MATYTLTVELPESVFQQLARIAKLTNQSLETIVAQSITSNLPPSADNAPAQMQTELLKCEYCRTSSKLTGMPLVMDHLLQVWN